MTSLGRKTEPYISCGSEPDVHSSMRLANGSHLEQTVSLRYKCTYHSCCSPTWQMRWLAMVRTWSGDQDKTSIFLCLCNRLKPHDPTNRIQLLLLAIAEAEHHTPSLYYYASNRYHNYYYHLLVDVKYRQNNTQGKKTEQSGSERRISRCSKYKVSYRIVSRYMRQKYASRSTS